MSKRRTADRKRRRLGALVERLEPRHLLAVTFGFEFIGDDGFGFDDPTLGQDRQDALVQIANEFGANLQHDASLEVEVFNGIGTQGAFAGAFFSDESPGNGFDPAVPLHEILTGEDRNGALSDGELIVNWTDPNEDDFAWELGPTSSWVKSTSGPSSFTS